MDLTQLAPLYWTSELSPAKAAVEMPKGASSKLVECLARSSVVVAVPVPQQTMILMQGCALLASSLLCHSPAARPQVMRTS